MSKKKNCNGIVKNKSKISYSLWNNDNFDDTIVYDSNTGSNVSYAYEPTYNDIENLVDIDVMYM